MENQFSISMLKDISSAEFDYVPEHTPPVKTTCYHVFDGSS